MLRPRAQSQERASRRARATPAPERRAGRRVARERRAAAQVAARAQGGRLQRAGVRRDAAQRAARRGARPRAPAAGLGGAAAVRPRASTSSEQRWLASEYLLLHACVHAGTDAYTGCAWSARGKHLWATHAVSASGWCTTRVRLLACVAMASAAHIAFLGHAAALCAGCRRRRRRSWASGAGAPHSRPRRCPRTSWRWRRGAVATPRGAAALAGTAAARTGAPAARSRRGLAAWTRGCPRCAWPWLRATRRPALPRTPGLLGWVQRARTQGARMSHSRLWCGELE